METARVSVKPTKMSPVEMLVELAGKPPVGVHGNLLDGEPHWVSCSSLATAC